MTAQQIVTHLALLVLLVAASGRAAAPDDGDNLPTMVLLCPALQLADGDIKLQPEQTELDADLQDLLTINMSLAAENWAAQFKASPDGAKPQGDTQQKQRPGTPEQIAAWTAAKAKVDNTETFQSVLAKYGYTQTNASKLVPLKGPIAQYADAAFEIQEAAKQNTAGGKTDSELKALIKTAIYGHDGTYDESKKEEMGIEGAGDRATTCTAAENSNPIATVATIVACLCAVKDNIATGKAPCGPYTEQNLKWKANGPPTKDLWTKIRSSCPTAANAAVTADRIASAIASAKRAFYAVGTSLYVGKYDDTDCNGSNHGTCIKYADQATGSVPSFEKATWIQKLETVETSLRTRQQNQDIQNEAHTKIETLKQLVKAATKHAEKLTPQTTQHQSDPKLATANDKNSQAQKTTDCSKLEKAECKPELGCKYNETTNKCENDAQNPVSKTKKKLQEKPVFKVLRTR
uniref:Variant surface glycoprotein 1125.1192 n=1 Tax=Trypanosoma brucei TaxID=5691 RepID=A0A1J0R4I1_9TRYP|nr:variant surface glycoprotein 1125.1192 [Trypanosoma brucei]